MSSRIREKPERGEKRGVFLADNAALDFLNTEWPSSNGTTEDFFESDADVFSWLRQANLAPEEVTEVRPFGALVRSAYLLRSVIRILIEERKLGKRPDLSDLNAFLVAAQSHPELAWIKFRIEIRVSRPADTADQILAPIAVGAAELLAKGDFNRVRRCDDATCVHWFYDLTKSGRRRWCSMATCGNKLKVRQYRRRLKAD
jgi:predicted RNA-binding Zn ribbon-like protein